MESHVHHALSVHTFKRDAASKSVDSVQNGRKVLESVQLVMEVIS